MNAPRALELNPGKKRVFKILAHQDQKPMANPIKARKGKTQLRAQTKFGPPLKLPVLSEMPTVTETEIRRRVGMIDDHLLARYPQIVDQLVPWLAKRADDDETSFGDIEDALVEMLELSPQDTFVASDIIQELIDNKILFEDASSLRLAGPGVGKPPPFTNAEAGARWALINVGADPDRAEGLLKYLDEMPLDENGEIDESTLSDFLEDQLFLNVDVGEYKPEDMQELVENLIRSNVLIRGSKDSTFYYDAQIAGRSDPYVVAQFKRMLTSAKQKGKDRSFQRYLQTQISDRERNIGRGGHFDEPPAGRPKTDRWKKVPKARSYSYPARMVQDLLPGDLVYEMGPVPHYATRVVSVEKGKGDWFEVTVQDGAGKQFTKRAKKDKLIAIEKEAPEPVFDPKYHPVERLKIDDPKLLQVLAFFEGQEWVNKQHRFPNCPKCVLGNKTAWEVLQSLGSKGKGITLGMLLDGAGRIEGAKHTGHWYEINNQGYVNIEKDTATDADVKALKDVGVESV